jgi:hypothetical protein
VRAAITDWHHLAGDRFPGLPDWSHEPQWQTHRERRHSSNLKMLAAERHHINSYLDLRAAGLRSDLDNARAAADLYERTLLTADSDELVEAVIRALSEFGFIVVWSTQMTTPRVTIWKISTSPIRTSPGWLVIAEVKGYAKGACDGSVSAVGKIQQEVPPTDRFLPCCGVVHRQPVPQAGSVYPDNQQSAGS